MTQPTTQDPGKRFSFVADLQSRDGGVTKDARIHNAFVEADGKIWQRPVLGSAVGVVGGTGTSSTGVSGQGLILDDKGAYSVAGGTLYQLQRGFSGSFTTAFGGYAALSSSGDLYRFRFDNGQVARSLVQQAPFSYQVVSTSGFISDAPNSVCMSEVPGFFWSHMSQAATWSYYYSTDGINWSASGALPAGGAFIGPIVGFGVNLYAYQGGTFTNGQTVQWVNGTATSGTAGTMAIAGTAAIEVQAIGTGNGKIWAWGTGHGVARLMVSSNGTAWSVSGSGSAVSNLGTPQIGRLAYADGAVYAMYGTGTGSAGRLLAMSPGQSWIVAGTVNAGGTVPPYKAIIPTSPVLHAILDGATHIEGSFNWSGLFSGLFGVASLDLSVQPNSIVRNSTTQKIVAHGASRAYVYDPVAGTSGLITGTNFPTNMVPGFEYLDATYYVMDTSGNIWNSTGAADDPTTWPTDGLITASFEPDGGVALTKALNYIVAMGQWSVELFWDAGNATGSPLSPVNNGVLLIGCAAAASITQLESTVIWIAQRKGSSSTVQKGRFVAMLVGTSYEEISTPAVNRILDNDDLAIVHAAVLELGGHTWFILGLGTSNLTLVRDMKEKKWYTWSRLGLSGSTYAISSLVQTNGLVTGALAESAGMADGDPVVIAGGNAGFNGTFNVNWLGTGFAFSYPLSTTGTLTSTGSPTLQPYLENYFDAVAIAGLGSVQLLQDSSGNVSTVSLTAYSDFGSLPVNVKLRSANMDGGNNERKFCFSIAVVGDLLASVGYGLLRFTDDDYQTYSQYRRFDLSQVRSNQQRWGNYRRRAWEWRYTGTVQHRLQYLEPDITQGVT